MAFIITEAGLAASTNAEGTGLNPVTLDHVKVYNQGAFQTEIQLQGVDLIEPARIYTVAEDSSNGEYDARELRFYTSDGVWFGTARQDDNSIIQSKGRASTFLLALELTLSQLPGSVAASGNISFNSLYATQTARGVVKFANDQEALTGRGESAVEPKVMTPENVRAHGDARYFKLNVTTRMMFASWPLPLGWTLDQSEPDRMVMLTGTASHINKTGGNWTISGLQYAGSHKHDLTIESAGNHLHPVRILGRALTQAQLPRLNLSVYGVNTTYPSAADGWNRTARMGIPGEDLGPFGYRTTNGAGTPLVVLPGGNQEHDHEAEVDSAGDHTHESAMENNGSHTHRHDGNWRPAYRKFAIGEYTV